MTLRGLLPTPFFSLFLALKALHFMQVSFSMLHSDDAVVAGGWLSLSVSCLCHLLELVRDLGVQFDQGAGAARKP